MAVDIEPDIEVRRRRSKERSGEKKERVSEMAIKIALAGNPNCGKTTLFNALTGGNQYVGNWPGVTVEKKEGRLRGNKEVTMIDLPGIYSLSPYTLEEVVARNYLISEKPDAIINIIDGTNIERNLYLSTQILELGIPVVIAVNMMDIVERNGDRINTGKLAEALGCGVVEISALKGRGIDKAVKKAVELAEEKKVPKRTCRFTPEVEDVIESVKNRLEGRVPAGQERFFAVKLLEGDYKIGELAGNAPDVSEEAGRLEKAMDDDVESIIANERYTYISSVVRECVVKKRTGGLTMSDKIDKIVTNRILALPIFAVVMFGVYYIAMVGVGAACTDWVNDALFGEILPPALERALAAIGCADWLSGLILDGIVAGVGAVLGFVPQMLVLFILLAVLEGCGYMARIAFIMDRIFRRFGLSGKSFIPMLVGVGCGVPGIMASRTIESDRDRKMTIMTTTFIPCGAKMPIVGLIAGALFGGAAWVATSAYFVGVAAIIISGVILKKTRMFAGDAAPFVMELPAYHLPTVSFVFHSMWERGWSFIKKAGTIILLSTIVLWFFMRFGWTENGFGMLEAEQLDNSILAGIGNMIAWIFIPLGFGDWRMAVATVTGLIAKENVVMTFGQLFLHLSEVSEEGEEVWGALSAALTPVAGYAFLVFNLLCAPCFAAMGAIRREMNNGKWFWFAVGYQCLFAYVMALIVYRIGGLFFGVPFGIWTAAAFVLLAGLLYLLFKPYQEGKRIKADLREAAAGN